LLFSACFDVHCYSFIWVCDLICVFVFFYHFNHSGSLLTEYYIRLTRRLLKFNPYESLTHEMPEYTLGFI
jgi:hypothetical protein